MYAFCWQSDRPLPPALDLTGRGWRRMTGCSACGTRAAANHAMLVDGAALLPGLRAGLARLCDHDRRRALVAGVAASADRAVLLSLGFGDAIALPASTEEIEQRAMRLLVPQSGAGLVRRAGPLLLDLAARAVWLAGRRIGLHPREFELLWALAERPGGALGKGDLLHAVCRIAHDPGTNRIAVHVSRLRAKLAQAGVIGLVETVEGGAYRLAGGPASSAVPRDEGTGPRAPFGQSVRDKCIERKP